MSSVTGHTAHSERPERSRNAKAQARHRAKRKAYIEQLEQTVTKLQTALGFSPEQVAALPPPLVKIRELEQENARLQKENEDLRRMLSDTGARVSMDVSRRNSLAPFNDTRICDRDYKRRKMSGGVDEVYMNPNENGAHDAISRPPPLTIPQPLNHHYGGVPHNGSHHHGANNSGSLFNLHAPAFQMPNTPSGSSATSSPPFSPAQMQQPPAHSPANHRPPVSNHHVLSTYTQHTNHYGPVKVEDENYVPSNHHHNSHNGHAAQYSLPSYGNATSEYGMENMHTYSSERAQLHR